MIRVISKGSIDSLRGDASKRSVSVLHRADGFTGNTPLHILCSNIKKFHPNDAWEICDVMLDACRKATTFAKKNNDHRPLDVTAVKNKRGQLPLDVLLSHMPGDDELERYCHLLRTLLVRRPMSIYEKSVMLRIASLQNSPCCPSMVKWILRRATLGNLRVGYQERMGFLDASWQSRVTFQLCVNRVCDTIRREGFDVIPGPSGKTSYIEASQIFIALKHMGQEYAALQVASYLALQPCAPSYALR